MSWPSGHFQDIIIFTASQKYSSESLSHFEQCFIGHNIKGKYPVKKVLGELLKGNIVGVANGKAEYGPRALGNRSLLADPRGKDIKDKVNKIKHRQEFRPFAPSVLEEHAHEIFNMPVRKSQFMQFVADCKYPDSTNVKLSPLEFR